MAVDCEKRGGSIVKQNEAIFKDKENINGRKVVMGTTKIHAVRGEEKVATGGGANHHQPIPPTTLILILRISLSQSRAGSRGIPVDAEL